MQPILTLSQTRTTVHRPTTCDRMPAPRADRADRAPDSTAPLPVLYPSRTSTTRDTQSEKDPATVHTLLVEDDACTAQVLLGMFAMIGADVTWSNEIGKARTAVAERAFDLMLIDHFLPDGLGREFIHELVDRTPPIPSHAPGVILMSAQDQDGFDNIAHHFAFLEFHPKPLRFGAIKEKVSLCQQLAELKSAPGD